jgi:HD-like signal output (HDOD) protein
MTPESLLGKFRASSSPPTIYLRLNDEVNHPDSSLARVGTIISEDASLSARLLRLVNSSFYGFPQRIDTISQAVFLVGSRQVRDLALVTTLMNAFGGIPEELIDTEDFWLHSLACGTGSKCIASAMGKSDMERYFMLGVMHDIGRIVIFNALPEISVKMLQRADRETKSLTALEQEELGFTHADVGRSLAEHWKLPHVLQEVVSYHHRPGSSSHYPVETAIVHTADVLSHALQIGSSGEPAVPPLSKKAWERLGIPAFSIRPLMESIHRETKALAWLPSGAKEKV